MLNLKKEKPAENKEVLSRLIEDVLKALDVPVNRISNSQDKENVDPESNDTSMIGNNPDKSEDGSFETCQQNYSEVPEKKKRGRKKKLDKIQSVKLKKINAEVDEGFKYQCERCTKVFSSVTELESHRDKDHASNFNCDECGQVIAFLYFKYIGCI